MDRDASEIKNEIANKDVHLLLVAEVSTSSNEQLTDSTVNKELLVNQVIPPKPLHAYCPQNVPKPRRKKVIKIPSPNLAVVASSSENASNQSVCINFGPVVILNEKQDGLISLENNAQNGSATTELITVTNVGKPRLKVEEKSKILELHDQGYSNGQIARALNCSKTTIARWLNRWKTEGHVWVRTVNGRPRVTTAQQDANIIDVLNGDTALTSKNIQEQLQISASRRTIIRRLGEAGLYGKWANKKDFIQENQKSLRLDFANQFTNYPIEFWNKVIFCDTFIFACKKNGRFNVHRPYEINHHTPKAAKSELFSVYIWAWLSLRGINDLWEIEGSMTQAQYRSILRDKMIQSIFSKYRKSDINILQDRTPLQITTMAREWCKKTGLNVLCWPPRSADLKPLDRVCTDIKQILNSSKEPPRTREALSSHVYQAWHHLMNSPGYKQALVVNVPLTLAAVITKNGNFL